MPCSEKDNLILRLPRENQCLHCRLHFLNFAAVSVAGSLVVKTNIGAKNAVFDLVSTRSPHVHVVKNAWCLSSLVSYLLCPSETDIRISYYLKFLFGAQCTIMAWIFFALCISCHLRLDSSLMNFKGMVQGMRASFMIYMEMYYLSKDYIFAHKKEWNTSISLPVCQ